jgi:hypothetical protein
METLFLLMIDPSSMKAGGSMDGQGENSSALLRYTPTEKKVTEMRLMEGPGPMRCSRAVGPFHTRPLKSHEGIEVCGNG